MGKIAPVQIKLIKMAQKYLGISDDDYREMLRERYKCRVGSCKELNYNQASELIDHFNKMGFKPKKKKPAKRKKAPGIIELPSPEQTRLIERLAKDIRWSSGWKIGLAGYTKRMLKGHERPRDIAEASKLIECLKGYKKRQQKEAGNAKV